MKLNRRILKDVDEEKEKFNFVYISPLIYLQINFNIQHSF